MEMEVAMRMTIMTTMVIGTVIRWVLMIMMTTVIAIAVTVMTTHDGDDDCGDDRGVGT